MEWLLQIARTQSVGADPGSESDRDVEGRHPKVIRQIVAAWHPLIIVACSLAALTLSTASCVCLKSGKVAIDLPDLGQTDRGGRYFSVS